MSRVILRCNKLRAATKDERLNLAVAALSRLQRSKHLTNAVGNCLKERCPLIPQARLQSQARRGSVSGRKDKGRLTGSDAGNLLNPVDRICPVRWFFCRQSMKRVKG